MATTTKQKRAEEFLKSFDGDIEAAINQLKELTLTKTSKNKKTPDVSKNPIIVDLIDIVKSYKVGRQKVEALKGISLQIREGEFIALTGPSGSGKSTLLQIIGALDKPTSGEITINGQNIKKLTDRKLSVFRNQTIGFVFQFFFLQPFLNLQTNLEVPAMFARVKPKDRRPKAIELAAEVGLSERVKHLPKELSGGQMQRAAIARAMLNNPKIILADEPTGNLDSENGQIIIDLFEKVRQTYGTTIVVVTHDPKIAARADRQIELNDGKL